MSRYRNRTAPDSLARSEKALISRILQRELILLIALAMVAIGLFLFTRSMAARNRAMTISVARTWYDRGREELAAGQVREAVRAFRNAATNDHDNPEYVLALAAGLAADNQVDEARQALLRLRMSAPENGEINLNLARLAAREADAAEAVRYYHNALFGLWPLDQMPGRRTAIRSELVRFLLEREDNGAALSELLILAADPPAEAEADVELGNLFLRAGDSMHALEQFARALRLDSKDPGALIGAGEASFNLSDYAKARRFFEAAVANGGNSPGLERRLETVKLVLSEDPLAARLSTDERIRRTDANLRFASNELDGCYLKTYDASSLVIMQPLRDEIVQGLQDQYKAESLRRDADAFRMALNLIYRIGSATGQICDESSPRHEALLLIARKHEVVE